MTNREGCFLILGACLFFWACVFVGLWLIFRG